MDSSDASLLGRESERGAGQGESRHGRMDVLEGGSEVFSEEASRAALNE